MTVRPGGAPAGTYYDRTTKSYIIDPGGTYSAAGATAPTTDPAGTYSSPYALDRLVILWKQDTPDNSVLSFTSAAQVEQRYGYSSQEATIARHFFRGYQNVNGVTLSFTRWGMGQRPHLLGANLANLTLAQLQAINGTIDMQLSIPGGPTFDYSGTIDLSHVTSFFDAATQIRDTLNNSLQVVAKTQSDTIEAENVSFEGYVMPGQASHLFVTSVTSGSITPGGMVSGQNITPGSQIIGQISGTPGGPGEYNLFGFRGGPTSGGGGSAAVNPGTTTALTNTGMLSTLSATAVTTPASTPMSETYGLLTVGSLTSGTLAVGERIRPNATIPALTAIAANISGTGAGSKWVVNNAVNYTGRLTMTAPGLTVENQNYHAKDGSLTWDFFEIQPDGHYGFNYHPASGSYMTGTAADALGLSQAAGAANASPGGQNVSVANFMQNIMQNETDQYGNPVHFGSLQTNQPRLLTVLGQWADSPDGMAVQLFSQGPGSTPPAGQSTPVTDPPGTWSPAGASSPTWGNPPANIAAASTLLGASAGAISDAHGYSVQNDQGHYLAPSHGWNPVGHGPGSSA
jgi:hypothetical protein